jgi:hypothetical protein
VQVFDRHVCIPSKGIQCMADSCHRTNSCSVITCHCYPLWTVTCAVTSASHYCNCNIRFQPAPFTVHAQKPCSLTRGPLVDTCVSPRVRLPPHQGLHTTAQVSHLGVTLFLVQPKGQAAAASRSSYLATPGHNTLSMLTAQPNYHSPRVRLLLHQGLHT